ncbi:unnamed protein product [Effrenium voratum]|nr:unnamed protein product [Effrenium voratum]
MPIPLPWPFSAARGRKWFSLSWFSHYLNYQYFPGEAGVFSFGIEYHQIHHFDIRVPGYRLERCDQEGEATETRIQGVANDRLLGDPFFLARVLQSGIP